MPGRFQVVDDEPLTVLDGAHNPEGIAALAESLPRLPRRAAGSSRSSRSSTTRTPPAMLRALLPLCDEVVFTRSAQPARAAARRRSRRCARQLGGPPARTVARTRAARSARARELAGADGVVLATGSIYLVADLLRPPGAERRSRRCETTTAHRVLRDDRRSSRSSSPLVILVFFAIGYGFGRLFL